MERNKLLKIIFLIVIIILVAISYYAVRLYYEKKQAAIPDTQAQGELDYGQASKSNAESKPFLKFLPYHSDLYDIYYDSLNDEIQIIFKIKTMSLDEAKDAFQGEIIKYLVQIGVKTNSQKISWLITR